MKKIFILVRIIALFVFCYNFTWELTSTLTLATFMAFFELYNIPNEKNGTLSFEEILLYTSAVAAIFVICKDTNLIGILGLGIHITMLFLIVELDSKSKSKGLTNKEYYGK